MIKIIIANDKAVYLKREMVLVSLEESSRSFLEKGEVLEMDGKGMQE